MIRSKKDIMRSLLKRAFQENRGAEVMLLIQWRKAAACHEAKTAFSKFERQFKVSESEENQDSRALKAFNFIAHIEGRADRLVATPPVTFEDLMKGGDIRFGLSFIQAHIMFSDNAALVKYNQPDGSHYYRAEISNRAPVLH